MTSSSGHPARARAPYILVCSYPASTVTPTAVQLHEITVYRYKLYSLIKRRLAA
jgi:hypothetical protein